MKIRSLILVVMAVLLASAAIASLRAYGAWGTATDVNTQLTVSFTPREVCITNTGGANALYTDLSGDGVAAATSGSTNFQLNPAARKCFDDLARNPAGTYLIGLICAAGLTTTYQVEAIY